MIKQLSTNIVNWQIKNATLSEEQRALYQYAYEVFINQSINVLFTIVVAVILRSVITVLVFSVCYLWLRGYCGGYHASTHGRCVIASTMLIFIISFAVKCVNEDMAFIISPICFAITGIVIFLLAPVEDKNKPLDEIEIIRYRKRGRCIWVIQAIVGMIFWYFNPPIGVIIALSHAIFTIILVMGKIKNNIVN